MNLLNPHNTLQDLSFMILLMFKSYLQFPTLLLVSYNSLFTFKLPPFLHLFLPSSLFPLPSPVLDLYSFPLIKYFSNVPSLILSRPIIQQLPKAILPASGVGQQSDNWFRYRVRERINFHPFIKPLRLNPRHRQQYRVLGVLHLHLLCLSPLRPHSGAGGAPA